MKQCLASCKAALRLRGCCRRPAMRLLLPSSPGAAFPGSPFETREAVPRVLQSCALQDRLSPTVNLDDGSGGEG